MPFKENPFGPFTNKYESTTEVVYKDDNEKN